MLESTLITWTKQIKNVLKQVRLKCLEGRAKSRPLRWKCRFVHVSCLQRMECIRA